MDKTNALRLLDSKNIKYEIFEYDNSITNGEQIAKILNEDMDAVFKTLVTIGSNHEHYCFVVPVNATLDLKKAAKAVNVKSIQMILQKELYPLTGYFHGGCSPVGMKKQFETIINDTALLFDEIYVSAGKVGMQMKLNREELVNYINAKLVDVIS